MKFCSKCGTAITDADAFCQGCGHRLTSGPSAAERIGRAVGDTSGFATRSFVGTATEPVVDAAWKNRPNIPTWQKVLGTIAWPVMLLTPHGWVFLGASFFVMVILGDHTPYSWVVWATKWGGIFVVATILLIIIVWGIAIALNNHGENTGLIMLWNQIPIDV